MLDLVIEQLVRARLVGASGLLLVAFVAPRAHATNVLLLLADDLGADKVGFASDYGATVPAFLPVTPALDDLAAAGVVFSNAWATPLCSPTRASLLTGDFPFHHGVGYPVASGTTGNPDLDEADDTVADAFAASGFATASFGKWHLGVEGSAGTAEWSTTTDCADGVDIVAEDANPVRNGFQAFGGFLEGAPESYTAWTRVESTGGSTTLCVDSSQHVDDYVVDATTAWIGSVPSGTPWFALVSFSQPHTDHDGRARAYEAADVPAWCTIDPADSCVTSGSCGDADGDGTDDAQDLVFRYLVECLDRDVDALLAAIPTATLRDTIVVFMGDNGTPDEVIEAPFDQSVSALSGDGSYGKYSTFESGIHVPLVIADGQNLVERWAGRRFTRDEVASPGRTVSRTVIVEDLAETLLDAAGATPIVTDGQSFQACLSSASASCASSSLASRLPYTEVYDDSGTGTLGVGTAAYRWSTWKLVMEYDETGLCMYPSLYAAADLYETADVYASYAATARRMKLDVNTLHPTWMPVNSAGNVKWCR